MLNTTSNKLWVFQDPALSRIRSFHSFTNTGINKTKSLCCITLTKRKASNTQILFWKRDMITCICWVGESRLLGRKCKMGLKAKKSLSLKRRRKLGSSRRKELIENSLSFGKNYSFITPYYEDKGWRSFFLLTFLSIHHDHVFIRNWRFPALLPMTGWSVCFFTAFRFFRFLNR